VPLVHPDFEVVAAVLVHEGRICLLRRSPQVSSDAGLWHCVTGYLPPGADPMRHALLEVAEETGLAAASLQVDGATVLDLAGTDGHLWRVHSYRFRTSTRDMNLNWEHDAVRWVAPHDLQGLPTVRWFGQVLHALSKPGAGSP
jgi:8-oxo-dGTP pyrophosphatase MutT (NUDIX family)